MKLDDLGRPQLSEATVLRLCIMQNEKSLGVPGVGEDFTKSNFPLTGTAWQLCYAPKESKDDGHPAVTPL